MVKLKWLKNLAKNTSALWLVGFYMISVIVVGVIIALLFCLQIFLSLRGRQQDPKNSHRKSKKEADVQHDDQVKPAGLHAIHRILTQKYTANLTKPKL